jgi:DNA-binding MarR family transcriptional regulator
MNSKTSPDYEALKLDNQLCFPLYAASRLVIKLYKPLLDPLGLTYTQYITLMSLWEKDGVTVNELGQRLYLDSGTLTPLLKKLETQGLVKRERDSKDERNVRVFLTGNGRNIRAKLAHVPQSVAACTSFNLESAKKMYKMLYELIIDLARNDQT